MKLETRLVIKMEQGLALLPKMLQSIEVLQLTSADLLALIGEELEQNETLVVEAANEIEVGVESSHDPDWDGEHGYDAYAMARGSAARDSDRDGKLAFLNNVPDLSESLVDYVQGQLGWLDLPAHLVSGVASLAERLDDRGLLTASDAELLELLDQEVLDQCVAILQRLEPRGIGARGPIEAMLLQLPADDPDFPDIAEMLNHHLEALAKNKLPEVARSLGRTVEEVQGLLCRIERLDPRPGTRFAVETGLERIHPDVTVRLVGDRIEIELDDMVLPDLGIDANYANMVRDAAVERRVKHYLRDKLRSARDLIHAVEQRKRTLARVTLAIMAHQMDFLRQGALAVRSLCMSSIADQLGVHPSTVSRAIAGKHVQTDHGIFRLRDFFDGDRRSAAPSGVGKGRMAIKDHIRDIVGHEDSALPLSDDEIVQQLLCRNISVARRTVAKYRKELGLPSSWRRREFE